jgi:hypothetical protein
MKAALLFVAGLAVAVLSNAPANAEHNCSISNYPAVSTKQCTKPKAANYAQCGEMLRKNGWEPTTAWWWCTSQHFKS